MHIPLKLDSELTIQHSRDINVLEHLLRSDIRYAGSKESHTVYLINNRPHKLWSSPELSEVQFVERVVMKTGKYVETHSLKENLGD